MRDEGIPTVNAFSQEIENMVWDRDVSYMDAVLIWCEDRGIEPEVAAGLIKKSQPLKIKLQLEAEERRLLPRDHDGARLFE